MQSVPFLHLWPLATIVIGSLSLVFPFLGFHISGILKYVCSVLVHILSCSVLFLRFVHVVGDIVVPIYCSVVFVDLIEHSLFIHSPVDKYLACFWSLAITKRLLWTCECKFLCGHTFSYLGMGLLGHMGRLSLTFYKKLPNFSKVTVTFCIPHKQL